MSLRADRAAGIAAAAAGIGLLAVSLGIEAAPAQPILSAAFFPVLLSIALIGSGAFLAVRSGPRELSTALRRLATARVVLLAGLVLVYFLGFRYVDFRLSTWAFMLLALLALGSRRPLELIVVPGAVSLGVYAVFRYGFSVLLPVWTS